MVHGNAKLIEALGAVGLQAEDRDGEVICGHMAAEPIEDEPDAWRVTIREPEGGIASFAIRGAEETARFAKIFCQRAETNILG